MFFFLIRFFTETAVGAFDGSAEFFTDDDEANLEYGGSVIQGQTNSLRKDAEVCTYVQVARHGRFDCTRPSPPSCR